MTCRSNEGGLLLGSKAEQEVNNKSAFGLRKKKAKNFSKSSSIEELFLELPIPLVAARLGSQDTSGRGLLASVGVANAQ